jgi:drug/metabolite transporter (DMT)-like permease
VGMSRRGWLLFSAMAVIWGIPYLLIRVAVRHLDPGVLVLGRTLPAAALLMPLVFWKRQVPILLRNFAWIAIFGVVEFGVPWYLMATAEKRLTSSLTSLLICAVPLFSVLAQRFSNTEGRISARRYAGLGLGALGVALLVGLDLKGGSLTWIGLMMVVCVGYTLGPIILATKLSHVPGIVVVAGASLVVGLCWIPWSTYHWPSHISSETLGCVAALSVVCTAGAFLTFFELIKEVGATRATVVPYVNTAIAVVLGVVGLHEPLTVGIIVGFPLVLIGSIFATSSARRDNSSDFVIRSDSNLVINE